MSGGSASLRRVGTARRRGPIGDLIQEVLSEVGLDRAAVGFRLLQVWDEALGPALAPHCRPDGIRRQVLHALVPDSAWMQRIQLETPQILDRLREHLGDEAPAALRLVIAGRGR